MAFVGCQWAGVEKVREQRVFVARKETNTASYFHQPTVYLSNEASTEHAVWGNAMPLPMNNLRSVFLSINVLSN